MTSEFRLEVSMPTAGFRSTSRTELLGLCLARLAATAKPTTPPPMMVCEKSAERAGVEEKLFMCKEGVNLAAPPFT